MNKHRYSLLTTLFFVAITLLWFSPMNTASAAGLTNAMVRFDRMSTSTATGGRVCATPSAASLAQTEASVQVAFPTGFGVNTTAANWTVSTTGLDTGQTAWPGILTATNVTGQTVTFPSGNLTSSSTLYCFNFATSNTITTPGSIGNNLAGTITTRTSAPATIDTASYATSIIANDQIVVTASVGATFTFALSGSTDSFGGNLDPAVINSTTGRTVTLNTNAAQGWLVWARDSQNNGAGRGSLFSTAANYYIAASAAVGSASRTMTPGIEDYGLAVTVGADGAGGGTVSIHANYDGTGSKVGTLDPTSFKQIASADGTASNDSITLVERATISNGTPAASDYTDTISVVGAGRF